MRKARPRLTARPPAARTPCAASIGTCGSSTTGRLGPWAVPNGIPDDPKRNRKAIHVEDHPLDYISFHGTIPAGNYGAGEVTCPADPRHLPRMRSGGLATSIKGLRCTPEAGRYALFQAGRDERDWIDPPHGSAAELDAEESCSTRRCSRSLDAASDESQWAFEVKWDGARQAIGTWSSALAASSRPAVSAAIAAAGGTRAAALNWAPGACTAILDGQDRRAPDGEGRPSFQLLQTRMHLRGEAAVRRQTQSAPVTYMIFDLLWLDGHSLMALPAAECRRARAARGQWPALRVPESFVGEGSALLEAYASATEGVIGKRLRRSATRPRRHSAGPADQELDGRVAVIAARWGGQGGRAGRSLLLGMGDADAQLRYVGRVGTGFDARELPERLAALATTARADTVRRSPTVKGSTSSTPSSFSWRGRVQRS